MEDNGTARQALSADCVRNLKSRISSFKSQFAYSLGLPLLCLFLALALASPAAAEVQLPGGDGVAPIAVNAQWGNRWQAGSREVWVLGGNCEIRQGQAYARCREAVLWIERTEPTDPRPNTVTVYLEGDVEVRSAGSSGKARLIDHTWYGEFQSTAGVGVQAAATYGKPDALPPVYWRAAQRRDAGLRRGGDPTFAARKLGQSPALGQSPEYPVRQVQWAAPAAGAGGAPPAPGGPPAGGNPVPGARR